MKQQDNRPAKRAVLYLRTRTVGGDDSQVDAQLERQRVACQQIARRHGAHVVHEYAAIGGTRDGHVRYIVSTMLTAAARDHVDYVITTNIDRLCRGPAEADRDVMRAIQESGARLLCPLTWDVSAPRCSIDDLAEATRQPRMHLTAMGRPA